MRPTAATLLGLCLAATVTACEGQEGLSEADIAAINQLGTDFVQATLARDFDRILAQRTDSVVWMPPGAPAIKGKAALRQFLEAGPRAVRFEATPVYTDGRDDLAFARGSYVYAAEAGADTVTETGKYVAVLFRQPDGAWLVGLEMWNSDAPPPAPTSPEPARRRP
jgi:ketosteroid isomerase-like protein